MGYPIVDETVSDGLIRATMQRRVAAAAAAKRREPLPTWQALTLQSGWSVLSGYQAPAYYRDQGGRVYLTAAISSGRISAVPAAPDGPSYGTYYPFGSTPFAIGASYPHGPAFILPPEARPANKEALFCACVRTFGDPTYGSHVDSHGNPDGWGDYVGSVTISVGGVPTSVLLGPEPGTEIVVVHPDGQVIPNNSSRAISGGFIPLRYYDQLIMAGKSWRAVDAAVGSV